MDKSQSAQWPTPCLAAECRFSRRAVKTARRGHRTSRPAGCRLGAYPAWASDGQPLWIRRPVTGVAAPGSSHDAPLASCCLPTRRVTGVYALLRATLPQESAPLDRVPESASSRERTSAPAGRRGSRSCAPTSTCRFAEPLSATTCFVRLAECGRPRTPASSPTSRPAASARRSAAKRCQPTRRWRDWRASRSIPDDQTSLDGSGEPGTASALISAAILAASASVYVRGNFRIAVTFESTSATG